MATSTYLSNPVVTVNAVDVTDQTSAANLTRVIEALEKHIVWQNSTRVCWRPRKLNIDIDDVQQFCCVRNLRNIVSIGGHIHNGNQSNQLSAATSATNPISTLTGCYLETLPIVNAALGALDTIDITFTGGVYSVATS
jgi:hypothetical protein